ncbi:hypothetical protein QUB19_01570 [Microcoleus sp. B4-C5]|uniref:hypothetical protein n=1 Tax=unclassified Microcoleus TaxID=2642155 RepID=UPI002FD1536B
MEVVAGGAIGNPIQGRSRLRKRTSINVVMWRSYHCQNFHRSIAADTREMVEELRRANHFLRDNQGEFSPGRE